MRLNPYEADVDAYGYLRGLAVHLAKSSLDSGVRLLAELRVSQINGCAFCLAMHSDSARKRGVAQSKLDQLAGWRDSSEFSAEERAALALAEEVTRIGDGTRVSDATWKAAREVFSDDALAALLYAIGLIQLWNILNVASEVPAGLELPRPG
jgi:AhpD family alkylhydroperoxidase